MTSLLQDLRYAFRVMVKNPGFTLAAVLSLALGIGANTTIFTLVNAMFLRPLPIEDPSSVVGVFTTDEKNTGGFNNFLPMSQPNFRDYREQNRVFSGMILYQFIPLSLTGSGAPEQVFGQIVSGNFFDVLGVEPAAGRFFRPDEDKTPGAAPVVVISYGAWQRRFGGDPGLMGRTITLNGNPYTVIGVTPEGFHGLNAIGGPDCYIPQMMYEQVLSGIFREWYDSRRALLFNIAGRLKPGVTPQQAQAELQTIARQLQTEYPRDNDKRSVTLLPIARTVIGANFHDQAVRAGTVLMAVVGLVLLIACANIANLLLARAAARRKEVALRLSLGASRGRLIRQLLTESVLLALLGGGVGFALGVWGRDVLWSFRPPFLADTVNTFGVDDRVVMFTFGLSLLTGLLFGLAPAFQASRQDLVVELKDKSSQTNRTARMFTLRNGLVVAEVALALVSLIGAGLFLKSLRNAQQIDPGFNAQNLVMMNFNLGSAGYDEGRGRQFHTQVLERARTVPGVVSAALGQGVPLFGGGGGARSVFPEGHEATPGRGGVLVQLSSVTPDYLKTLGIPLVRGRGFSDTDRQNTPRVVVINQAMANRFWPSEDPIGKRFKFFGEEDWQEVVGVVRDAKYNTIGEPPTPFLYVPLEQAYAPFVTLVVKSAGDAATTLATVRSHVQQLDRQLPLTQVQLVTQVIDQSLFNARMAAGLLGLFGVLALVLASIGIYGVMAYSVSQRTQEIGIRMALGAGARDVIALILRQSMTVVLIGGALGLVIATFAARSLASLLFGIEGADPVTFAVTSALLAAVAFLASYLPARRATRVDPLVALRAE